MLSEVGQHWHISLNGQDFTELDFNEAVRIKVYSEGPLEILAYVPHSVEVSYKVDVVKGEHVYCVITRKGLEEIESKSVDDHYKDVKEVEQLEEDMENPISSTQGQKGHDAVGEHFSYVNIVNAGYTAEVFVGGDLIGLVGRYENLKLKVYSEGRLRISFISSAGRIPVFLDIENNQEYIISTSGTSSIGDKSERKNVMSNFDKVNKITRIREDKNHPFITNKYDGWTQGTGFLVSRNGYVITNEHVVSGAEKVSIKGIAGDFDTWHEAKVVAVDVGSDMALLKLTDESITFDEIPYLIKSESIPQGSKAFVLGYPLTTAMGDEIKITDGLISAKSGYKGSLSQYQFSAAIQPGNSGSPLFNEKGEVIGIINSKLRGAESAGYAIKSSYIHTFVNQLDSVELSTTATKPATLVEQVQRNKPFVFIVKAE